jgi:bacterioferritin (cytochrome b1)
VDLDHDEAIEVLNEIVELELAGAVRYTQYSLMVFGHARIPIELYRKLLRVTEGASVSLEELARTMVRNEELHCAEIEKMLKKRGDA